jgi:hypothetical protein
MAGGAPVLRIIALVTPWGRFSGYSQMESQPGAECLITSHVPSVLAGTAPGKPHRHGSLLTKPSSGCGRLYLAAKLHPVAIRGLLLPGAHQSAIQFLSVRPCQIHYGSLKVAFQKGARFARQLSASVDLIWYIANSDLASFCDWRTFF